MRHLKINRFRFFSHEKIWSSNHSFKIQVSHFPKTIIVRFCLLVLLIQTQYIRVNAQKIRSLKNLEIKEINVILDSSYLCLPGYSIPIAIQIVSTSNETFYTKGFGTGTVRWTNFTIKVKGGSYRIGRIFVSEKLFPGDFIEIEVSSKFHPASPSTKRVQLNFIEGFKIYQPSPVFHLAPGNSLHFGISVAYNNGCKENVENLVSEERLMKSLKLNLTANGGEIKNSKLIIENDIDKITNHRVWIKGRTQRFPFVSDSISVLLDYVKDYYFTESGWMGFSGSSGSNGADGPSGSTSTNGSHGGLGQAGEDGENGEHGDDLEVFCDAFYDSILQTTLLYVDVTNLRSNSIKKYFVNPQGGNIYIRSSGGNGGCGGNGGSGGKGGNGGDGQIYYQEIKDSTGIKRIECKQIGNNGGNGGNGGPGGFGGNGGHGGNITVLFTPKTEKYLSNISIRSSGGMGGSGGNGGSGGSAGLGGSPGGSSGSSGSSGPNGQSGFSGQDGQIEWIKLKN